MKAHRKLKEDVNALNWVFHSVRAVVVGIDELQTHHPKDFVRPYLLSLLFK